MTAIIKPISGQAHWYLPDGSPCYELPKKDSSGMKTPTLADARKLGLLPGVSSILRVLDKPALTRWKMEQAVLACMTADRRPGESVDQFVDRVLNVEQQHEKEAEIARDRGKAIHDGLERFVKSETVPEDVAPFVLPVGMAIAKYGRVAMIEKHVVGDGYGGRVDVALEGSILTVLDFKTTKKLPEKGSWMEHRLQLAAYAKAIGNTADTRIQTVNVYISSLEPGQFVIHENPDWIPDYENGFRHLVHYWQFANDYYPNVIERAA